MTDHDMRMLLRTRTAAAHQRVDDRLGSLDLTTAAGLGRYLQTHHQVLGALEPQLTGRPGLPSLPARCRLIAADLEALGQTPRAKGTMGAPKMEGAPLGHLYVLGGSSLGARILKARWEQASDAAVRSAGQFVTDESMTRFWKEVLAALSTTNPHEADAVVRGAEQCFSLYADAFDQQPA